MVIGLHAVANSGSAAGLISYRLRDGVCQVRVMALFWSHTVGATVQSPSCATMHGSSWITVLKPCAAMEVGASKEALTVLPVLEQTEIKVGKKNRSSKSGFF